MESAPMTRFLVSLLALLAVLYLGGCVALFVFQRDLIYFPQPRSGPNALIYFGGNAEDVSLNLPGFSEAFPEHAIYLLHYRGYGGSTGQASEEAIRRDALAMFDRVQVEHPHTVVVGRSLGSGVAVYLASQRPAARLVLITPYDSLQEIAAGQFP